MKNVAWVIFAQAASSQKQRLMYFTALSIGYAVPRRDFDAAVHSVFKSPINLRLTRGSKLLTLVASSEADLPQGIRVDSPDDFSFEIFRAGEPVTCRNDILRCGPLTIELRGARPWKCDLPSLQADMTNPAVAIAWRSVWQALNKRQIQSNAEIIVDDICHCEEGVLSDEAIPSQLLPKILHENRRLLRRNLRSSQRHHSTTQTNVSRKAVEAMRELVTATRRYELTDNSAVKSLIGLGSGLTPSGDDLLVGYLAGLWCAVLDKSERTQSVSNLGKAVVRLSRQTNDISRTYLFHAVRGQISSRLADLAEVICHGENSDHLRVAAESAMQVGHTSGMDTVTGLLIGLAVWSSPGALASTSIRMIQPNHPPAR